MQDTGGERGSCLQWWPEAGGRRIRVDREGVYEEGMPSMCNKGERVVGGNASDVLSRVGGVRLGRMMPGQKMKNG